MVFCLRNKTKDYVCRYELEARTSLELINARTGEGISYITRAKVGNEFAYFDLGSVIWKEAEAIVNKNMDEMWKINKKFIDEQKALGKEFYLSHAPVSDASFYGKEIDYLIKPINQGGLGGTIVDQGNNLWKVIW